MSDDTTDWLRKFVNSVPKPSPTRLQLALGRLKRDPKIKSSLWRGSANEWVTLLGNSEKGRLGEDLAIEALGGARTSRNSKGYDIDFNGMRIEVKTCAMRITPDGYPLFNWMQIRDQDPYTHLCLIAILPESVRMFLIPRDAVPSDAKRRSHGKQGEQSRMFEIPTRKIENLVWLMQYEVK